MQQISITDSPEWIQSFIIPEGFFIWVLQGIPAVEDFQIDFILNESCKVQLQKDSQKEILFEVSEKEFLLEECQRDFFLKILTKPGSARGISKRIPAEGTKTYMAQHKCLNRYNYKWFGVLINSILRLQYPTAPYRRLPKWYCLYTC